VTVIGWALLVIAVLGGCGGAKRPQSYAPSPDYAEAYRGDYDAEEDESPSVDAAGSRRTRSEPPRASSPSPPPPPPPAGGPPEPEPDATEPVPRADRMVHYDGWARLRVGNPREALDGVVGVAAELGGRTERVAGNVAVIRVPVARFDEAWDRVLALGDVMDRSVRADDVTEAFTATELRARTLRETQKRLIELLAKAKEEEEKLQLLQQLTAVREELDALESQLRTLSDLAAMSRISVEVAPREAFTGRGGRPDLDGFGWIRALSPFRRAVLEDDKRIEVPVPDGLVALTPRGPFVAESADGAMVWTLRVDNDPVGQGPFWIGAVQDRLAEEFAEPAQRRLGPWECLTLQEPGSDEPYRWDVCVQSVGRKLHVAQVYYPGPEQVERYAASIDAALLAEAPGA
jgi:hypothetical protein